MRSLHFRAFSRSTSESRGRSTPDPGGRSTSEHCILSISQPCSCSTSKPHKNSTLEPRSGSILYLLTFGSPVNNPRIMTNTHYSGRYYIASLKIRPHTPIYFCGRLQLWHRHKQIMCLMFSLILVNTRVQTPTGYLAYSLSISMIFLSSSRQILGEHLRLRHYWSVHLFSNQLFTNRLNTGRYEYISPTACVLKKAKE